MSRRHKAEKREILPDPVFGDVTLNKFMNNIMIGGKKAIAERIVYGALEKLSDKKVANDIEVDADTAQKNLGLAVFYRALQNVKPRVEVRSRRVGGAVKRNRIKRLLREAFRIGQHDWPGAYDVIIVVYPHKTAMLSEYQHMLITGIQRLDRHIKLRESK